jgi:hypothetical protein
VLGWAGENLRFAETVHSRADSCIAPGGERAWVWLGLFV